MAFIDTLIFIIALLYFMAMAWISLSFFRTDDGGAKQGKLFISSTIGIAVCVTLWFISRSTAGAVTLQVAAIGLFGYAFYILFWAVRANSKRRLSFAFSREVPAQINRDGPYGFIRHPFYSSYCAAWIAAGLAARHEVVWIFVLFAVALYGWLAIREEKQFLASDVAQDYERYITETSMLLPLPRIRAVISR
jgi:protein-S-isoprenylcysteine O-methyltransferase Ste14